MTDRREQRELLGQRVGRALLDNRERSVAEQPDLEGCATGIAELRGVAGEVDP
jgi:hypothetical protein